MPGTSTTEPVSVEAREQAAVDAEALAFETAVEAARNALPAANEFVDLRSFLSTVTLNANVGPSQAKWALGYLKSLNEAQYRLGVGVTRQA